MQFQHGHRQSVSSLLHLDGLQRLPLYHQHWLSTYTIYTANKSHERSWNKCFFGVLGFSLVENVLIVAGE